MVNKKPKLNYRGEFFASIFLIIMLIISFLILGIAVYFLYENVPGTPQSFALSSNKPLENQISLKTSQFYPNMKFNHNSISYILDSNCEQEKQERMINAFDEFSNKIPEVSFHQVSENPDIEISCSEENKKILVNEDYFIAGEGGAKEIIQTGRYNVITNGIIFLYESTKNSLKCDSPNTEIHELIHVFGFGHSENKNSLMYPILESCNQKLEESTISELKRLYSEENLPDLYFEDAKAIKKGRYLDFNITIKNSGTVDANNIELTILEDGKQVENKITNEIKFGAGIFIEIQNLKLFSRNSNEIDFEIDPENKIKELDKSNNVIKIKFDGE